MDTRFVGFEAPCQAPAPTCHPDAMDLSTVQADAIYAPNVLPGHERPARPEVKQP